MRQFAGACRFVYNKALALQKENQAAGARIACGEEDVNYPMVIAATS